MIQQPATALRAAAARGSEGALAFAVQLGAAGLTPRSIETNATLTMEKLDAGWTITGIHLQTRARVPGAAREGFQQAAEAAKANCPVSRLLNTKITLEASLEA